MVGEQGGVKDGGEPAGGHVGPGAAEEALPGNGPQKERSGIATEEEEQQLRAANHLAEAVDQESTVGGLGDCHSRSCDNDSGHEPSQGPASQECPQGDLLAGGIERAKACKEPSGSGSGVERKS